MPFHCITNFPNFTQVLGVMLSWMRSLLGVSLIASYLSWKHITRPVEANKCISIRNESLCHGDYIILFTSAYCLGMLCFTMCMEDRWTVSPAIISYLPERHLFIGQQIELQWSHRQEKCWDRPAIGVCVQCQVPLHGDEWLQPKFTNDHFRKANRCIQHQYFLITLVSCGILCWRKQG